MSIFLMKWLRARGISWPKMYLPTQSRREDTSNKSTAVTASICDIFLFLLDPGSFLAFFFKTRKQNLQACKMRASAHNDIRYRFSALYNHIIYRL